MKYLLLALLFCFTCAALLLAQPRPEKAMASGPPSPALLEAMSSHGIQVSTAADTADAPAGADMPTVAEAPALQPAMDLAGQAPLLQPAVYRGGR